MKSPKRERKFSDFKDIYTRSELLCKVFKSKALQKHPSVTAKMVNEKKAPNIMKYEVKAYDEGYAFIFIDNREEHVAIAEKVTFKKFEGSRPSCRRNHNIRVERQAHSTHRRGHHAMQLKP